MHNGYTILTIAFNNSIRFILNEQMRHRDGGPTSFWWYLIASFSLARSWHCRGSSSSLWSLSLWFKIVSSSRELLAWSRRSLAKRLHCCESSSYSCRNSFSTWGACVLSERHFGTRLTSYRGPSLFKSVRNGAKASRQETEKMFQWRLSFFFVLNWQWTQFEEIYNQTDLTELFEFPAQSKGREDGIFAGQCNEWWRGQSLVDIETRPRMSKTVNLWEQRDEQETKQSRTLFFPKQSR